MSNKTERDSMHRPTLREQLTAKQQLLAEQREANERLLLAALRAQERTDQAEAARVRADAARCEFLASQERYRTLFELCPAGVYTCNAQGLIQEYNYHATVLWGRAPTLGDTGERFCGSFRLFRSDGSVLPHEQCPMADVVSGKLCGAHDEELLIERPDGSRVTVTVSILPLLNERGQLVGAIACFNDVTVKRVSENQLLESLSREGQLAEFRETFVHVLGQGLSRPLGSIIGSASALLRRGYLAEHDGVAVARILRSSHGLKRVVSRVVDFTRARLGGRLSIEPKPTDLRELCLDAVEACETTAEVSVEGDVTGTWDPVRLAEALSDLVENASRFARPGTAVLVAARTEGSEVTVEVRNQGDPIPSDVLPFLFEPFQRSKEQGDAAGELGLGLYIAHQIVLAHHGTLVGYSAGGTTTFVMRLRRDASGHPALGAFGTGNAPPASVRLPSRPPPPASGS